MGDYKGKTGADSLTRVWSIKCKRVTNIAEHKVDGGNRGGQGGGQ